MMKSRVSSLKLESVTTNTKKNLSELSYNQPVLLVFLRHFGCVFCKEALADLSSLKKELVGKKVHLVFVHMAKEDIAESYFTKFGLAGVEHVSDPLKEVYQQFGLVRGNVSQLFGLGTWMRGFKLQTNGYTLEMGAELGDSFQMPGLFVLRDGKVVEEYVHKNASDRPDYLELVECSLAHI